MPRQRFLPFYLVTIGSRTPPALHVHDLGNAGRFSIFVPWSITSFPIFHGGFQNLLYAGRRYLFENLGKVLLIDTLVSQILWQRDQHS